MKKIINLTMSALTVFFANTAFSLTVDEWLEKYKRPCSSVNVNQVCKERLDRSLKKMRGSIVPKMLRDNGLELWLATIPIVESDYNNKAVSKAGAVGLWQILPINIQTFYTRSKIVNIPLFYSGSIFKGPTFIVTKPSIELSKKIGKNPKSSTDVAIWLIKQLYGKYNDWGLTLQAYNSGQGRIDRYLRGEGKPLTFETLNYYTQILAIQKYIEEME